MFQSKRASPAPGSANAVPETIPVIVDVPRQDPGLGFEKYVSAVSAAIVGGNPAQYTLGLYGPWGTGKSSILLALREELKSRRSVKVVTFDAWRHERAQNLLAPLLWVLKGAVDLQDQDNVSWKRIFGGMEFQAFGFGFRVPSEADRAEKAMGAVEEYMTAIDSLARVGRCLPSGERVVVLIDDLDRCSPDRVIEAIEAIRLLMDVPGFVFVLAIDYDVLIDAVKTRYPHADAHRFVEKIVQVPFRIPNLDPDVDEYLTQVVDDWTELRELWFEGLTDEEIRSVIGLALRNNPRQIKRMLNSYMVARHIDWEGLGGSSEKSQVLLASLAMQLRWPREFEELASGIDRYNRGPGKSVYLPVLKAVGTYTNWTTEDDDRDDRLDFRDFLKRHLRGETNLKVVDEAMRIASDVAGGDYGVSTPENPEENRKAFTSYVLRLFSERSEEGFSSRFEDGLGFLTWNDHGIAQIREIRSVPQTFDLRVGRDWLPPDSEIQTTATRKTDGGWEVFSFGGRSGQSLDEALRDAAHLLDSVARHVA